MAFSGGKATPLVLLALIALVTFPDPTSAETHECTMKKIALDQGQNLYCVFSNVNYTASTKDIQFKAPGSGKQPNIAFEDSAMDHLPRQFLEKFGNDLKVLSVVSCRLKSVVITKSMEELNAINNFIEKVVVHQNAASSPLKVLNLQANHLSDISNITKNCKKVSILDLSRNENLAKDSEIDLSMFNGMNELQYLMLADVGALYLKNDAKPDLPSLTLLDLSMNNLIPSDVHWDQFQAFSKLEVLRLNDIGLAQLDYAHLTKAKSLKEVYLDGNSFDCKYLKTMIDFLNKNNVRTPVGRPAQSCSAGYDIVEQMCCKSEGLVFPQQTPSGREGTGIPEMEPPHQHHETTTPAAVSPRFNVDSVTSKPTPAVGTPKATDTGNGVTKLHLNLGFVLISFLVATMARD